MKKQHLLIICIFIFILFQINSISNIYPGISAIQMPDRKKGFIPSLSQQRIISIHSPVINSITTHFSDTSDSSSLSFIPENLSNLDDVYHTSEQQYATEWWYFDALLNNQYTIQFSVHVYTFFKTGFATIQCNIYDQGKSIIAERSFTPLSSITLSTQQPFIAIEGTPILIHNQSTDIYQVKHSTNTYSFNLTFQGITKGWKGTTTAGDWAVIHPKAAVTGYLSIQDETNLVTGIGYHDHNWNITFSTGLNFGWLWGKTITTDHVLTWASIFETWYKQNPLLVINKDHGTYKNIPSEYIDFSVTKIEFKNGLIIPYGFTISTNSQEYNISLSVEILDSDFITVFGLINYWRYHIHTKGTIQFNHDIETIDDYNIAEFIRFRPY
jgi:predicted secreted hydrolase